MFSGAPVPPETTVNIKTIKEARNSVVFLEKSPCLESMIILVDAELARLEGDLELARTLYNKSIFSAKQREVLSTEGIANEAAMKLCISTNDYQCVNYIITIIRLTFNAEERLVIWQMRRLPTRPSGLKPSYGFWRQIIEVSVRTVEIPS